MASTTITAKTYKAAFDGEITITISGLQAAAIVTETPDTTAKLDKRNALRREIVAALRENGADIGLIDWVQA